MKQSFMTKAAFFAAIFILAMLGTRTAFAADPNSISTNWSGYIAQNGLYTGVAGTWTIPSISYSSTLTSNATWVGIGGKTSTDLIQAGVYEIANSDGATYQAWYELLPDDSTPVSLAVHPGDSISVAILETSPNVWNVVLTNNTSKQQFEKTVNYQSSFSSAEWIQERPTVNSSIAALSGFTPVQFTGATAVQNGQRISLMQTNPQEINLLDAGTNTALAVPSPIDATTGTSFSVFRTSATSSATPNTISPFANSPVPQSQIPPYELHRTGRGISRVVWIISGTPTFGS
jgi:hypothetical protein